MEKFITEIDLFRVDKELFKIFKVHFEVCDEYVVCDDRALGGKHSFQLEYLDGEIKAQLTVYKGDIFERTFYDYEQAKQILLEEIEKKSLELIRIGESL